MLEHLLLLLSIIWTGFGVANILLLSLCCNCLCIHFLFSFGMNHDGQGDAAGCSSSNYIMSPSVGPGKTTWSTCSARVIHSFLRWVLFHSDSTIIKGALGFSLIFCFLTAEGSALLYTACWTAAGQVDNSIGFP